MRYYEGKYGFLNKTNNCKKCEFLGVWHITSNEIPIKRKEYSCILYEPYVGTIRNINKIAEFCKLSKDKEKYTSKKDMKDYLKKEQDNLIRGEVNVKKR